MTVSSSLSDDAGNLTIVPQLCYSDDVDRWGEIETGQPTLLTGDCHQAMQVLADAGWQADSIVTDPPYGVGSYDWGIPPAAVWETMMEVVKPGGFLITTGNPKTFHRQMVMIEDSGWLIRDLLMWLFSHGFAGKGLGEARWAVQNTLMGERAKIQRGIYKTEAREWAGWGSKLKPAWEPILLCQKPGSGDMGKDLVREGVGALRLEQEPSTGQMRLFNGFGAHDYPPNNLLVDEDVAGDIADMFGRNKLRAFWTPGLSQKERHLGVDTDLHNDHPTVKPIAIMRWMIRLVTPPGGTVLDPYCGSGTTGAAAMMENCQFVGIDIDEHWVDVARQRISYWKQEFEEQQQEEVRKAAPKPSIMPRVRIMNKRQPTEFKERTGQKCRNGHLLTSANVYTRPDGRQECLTCKRKTKKTRKSLGATG